MSHNPHEYVSKYSYIIPENQNAVFLRCIDGRKLALNAAKPAQEQIPHWAVPGETVGLALDVMAAANLAKRKYPEFHIPEEEIMVHKTRIIGTASFHDGDAHHKDPECPCNGCGYVALTLSKPDEFLIGPSTIEYMKKNGFAYVKSKMEQHGRSPLYYHGGHDETFAFIVNDERIGILPNGDTQNAYVMHRPVRDRYLREIAKAVFPENSAVPFEDWLQFVHEAAEVRLKAAMKYLKFDEIIVCEVDMVDGVPTVVSVSEPELLAA